MQEIEECDKDAQETEEDDPVCEIPEPFARRKEKTESRAADEESRRVRQVVPKAVHRESEQKEKTDPEHAP